MLDDLTPGVTLTNASGITACTVPSGSPFLTVPGPLDPGRFAAVQLHFDDPSATPIEYDTSVLAGAGVP